MFRIKDLPFHLAGEEERGKPPGECESTRGSTSRQSDLLCSCAPSPTSITCPTPPGRGDAEGGGEGEKDNQQQGLLRQQLRRELGEARP